MTYLSENSTLTFRSFALTFFSYIMLMSSIKFKILILKPGSPGVGLGEHWAAHLYT